MTTALAITTAALPAPRHDLVAAFLAGRSPQTLKAYRQDLEGFRVWTGAATVEDASRALLEGGHGNANGTALAWRASMVDAGAAPASINRRLAALRSLVKLARTLGLVPWTLEVEGLEAVAYRNTKGPGVDAVRSMLAVVDARTGPKAARDRAMLRCLFDLALRRGELVALDVAHVDLQAGTIAVMGKGRTARESLTLPMPTLAAIRVWLEARGTEPGPLFTTAHRGMRGVRLTGDGVADVLEELATAAGIKGKVRPHGLRHSSITRALDAAGGDVRMVAKFSRHRDVRTLTIYDDNRQDLAGRVASMVSLAL